MCVWHWDGTDWAIMFWFCRVPFSVDHRDHNLFFHELGVMESCLMIKLKTSCIIFVVSSSAPLTSSALIPLLSFDFPFFFFETVNRNTQFFRGEFWEVIVLFTVFNTFIIVSMVPNVLKSSVVCPSRLFSLFLPEYRTSQYFCTCVSNAHSSMPRCLTTSFLL